MKPSSKFFPLALVGFLVLAGIPAAYHFLGGAGSSRLSRGSNPTAAGSTLQTHGVTSSGGETSTRTTARPCDGTVLTHLDFSRPPTEAELIASGNLGKPLTPTRKANPAEIADPSARRTQEADNLAFGQAMQAWNEHRYAEAIGLFEKHLESFPDSPWAAESILHIGCYCQYNSRFNESAEWFDKAIAASGESSEMRQKAKLRRAMVNVLLGRLDEASSALGEFLRINTSSMDATYATYWLREIAMLKKNEAAFRDCGQKSLAKVAEELGMTEEARALFNLPSAGSHGFTAAELRETALRHGLDPHPVNAPLALDALPVPFIAHYKDKHYVTVTSVAKDSVKIHDSRLNSGTSMPRLSFEREWSGFAMLVKQPPQHEAIHPAENLSEISGGCCGINMQQSNIGKDKCDTGCNSPESSEGGTSGGPGGGGGGTTMPPAGMRVGFGLPSHSVNPVNMNFKVLDTPMWWDAPVGPDVEMTLLYNSQEGQNLLNPFGEKWAFAYASYVMITPGEAQAQVKDGDGRIEMFISSTLRPPAGQPYPQGGIAYTCNGDFRSLVETATHTFKLIHQDGTVFHYGIPAAMAGNSSVPLLLSIQDPHNNAVNITHNSQGAIIEIGHTALGTGVWEFDYVTIGSVSRVSRIDDPFGRSAHFSYNSAGNLTGQIDMGGLSYSYGYTSTANGAPLFISSITTPTGTTNIYTEYSTEPDPNPPVNGDGFYDASTYSQADQDKGYSVRYPLPGRFMWANYRITIRDHLNHPTEYFYDGFGGQITIRTPSQLDRPSTASVSPLTGSRTQMATEYVGDRGEIGRVEIYDENDNLVNESSSEGFDETSRLPSYVPDGNGGHHIVSYNTQGRTTQIKLNGNIGDSQIDISYQANGIDPDTIKRTYNGVLKTLADYNYYPADPAFPYRRNLQSVTDVTGRTLTFQWYANGLPQNITDSVTGDVVSFTYDANLRPYQTLVNNTVVSTTTYDTANRGNLVATLSPDGSTTSYLHDNLNRATRELRSDDTFTAWDWACCYIEAVREGKLVAGVEKTLKRSATFHDSRALPQFTTDTDGRTTRYEFDADGRFVKLTDPKNQITEWIYNAAGQLKEKKYPSGPSEYFHYLGNGKLQRHVSRRGVSTWFFYSYDGQPDSIQQNITGNPYGMNLGITFDPWRRPETRTITGYQGTASVNETITLGFDLLGRPTSIDGPWADDTITWTYSDTDADPNNNAQRSVTRTSPGGVTETVATDALGSVASIINPLGTFTHNRGGLGELLDSITHSGGFNTAFTWHGDTSDFALHTITSTRPGGNVIGKHTYTYGTFGQIASWKREAPLANPTGPTRQFESRVFYDPAEQVSSLIHTALAGSSVAESGHHYVYDTAGNIASKQVEKPGLAATMTTYGHNSLNQLSAIGGTGGVKTVVVRGETSEPASVKVRPDASSAWKNARMLAGQRFEADIDLATGPNQIQVQARDGSHNTSTYTYALDLATGPAATPTFDADGNMTGDGIRSYDWDLQNRLIKITWGAGSNKTTEFRYNALGQRSQRIEKTGTTVDFHHYYLYDGIRLLCRYTGGTATNNIDRRYFDQGEQRKNGSNWDSYYYTRDHLGSVREVLASNGTLVARYDYDPYGKRSAQYEAPTYANACDLGYTGHITQPSPVTGQTELVMTLFRAYDPELGRWLSADPIGEKGGFNLYAYVGGNPMFLGDLLGLRPPSEKFWPAFPDLSKDYPEVWKEIGGWIGKTYADEPNSCAARVSKGLNGSGEPIASTKGIQTNKNDDGKRYILNAAQLRKYLRKKWGLPDITVRNQQELDAFIKTLKPGQAAIGCSNRHAGGIKSGHFDPWMGTSGDADIWILPTEK